MHLTLKQEATKPASFNALQQQASFDAFVSEFNEERPHEALAMKAPAEFYVPSSRTYEGLPELEYPFHDKDSHRMRPHLHDEEEDQRLHRAGRSKARNHRSR